MAHGGEIITSAHRWLSNALANLDGDVLLTSPYLTTPICRQIARAVKDSPYRTVVVTTLDPSAVAGGYLMVQGLQELLNAGIELRHTERLHAKCFIVGSHAMLGSANLTGQGLGSAANSNRELGVSLDDAAREQARGETLSWPARIVTDEDLDELLEKAKTLSRPSKPADAELTPDLALQQAEKLLINARYPERGLWLKLEYGEPALEGWRQRTGSSERASPAQLRPIHRRSARPGWTGNPLTRATPAEEVPVAKDGTSRGGRRVRAGTKPDPLAADKAIRRMAAQGAPVCGAA